MPLTIKLGTEAEKPVQASIALQIRKTLDGNLLINDHQFLDIIVNPRENTVTSFAKPNVERDVFSYQKDLAYDLFKAGVATAQPRGGATFGMVESSYPAEGEVDTLQAVLYRLSEYLQTLAAAGSPAAEYDEYIEDRFTNPSDEDSTEHGEVLPYEDTAAGKNSPGDPTYSFAGYGYYY